MTVIERFERFVHSTQTERNLTDLQLDDPVKRLGGHTRVSVTTLLAAAELGRLLFSQFVRCEHSHWDWSSVQFSPYAVIV